MLALATQSSGVSHLLSLVERSVIYSSIRRFIYHLPLPVIIALFAIAALGVVFRGRMMGHRKATNTGTTITETLDKDGNVISTKKVTRQ